LHIGPGESVSAELGQEVGISQVDVAAGVARVAGRYLVCKRPADKEHGGFWEFPGGKHEDGEDASSALRREFKEELGVDVVSVTDCIFSAEEAGSPYQISFYFVQIEGEIELHEHDECRWCTLAALRTLNFAPIDQLFVGALLQESSV